jgi:1-acyl-sn-glycerol-3-phosphate acyltransferase
MFPEGTRSPDGRLYRGHTGAARLALATGAQVLPVALLNSGLILPRGRLIPKIMRVRIVIGQPIQPGRRVGAEVSAGSTVLSVATDEANCRVVTDAIMRAIQRLSGQEYVDSYAPWPTESTHGDAAVVERQSCD